MNERIQELKQQAADYVDSIDNGIGIEEYRKLLDQKFAELIVRECMRMCEVTQMGFETHGCSVEASGAITVKEYIAEHFEVE